MYQYKTSIKNPAPTADLAMRQICMRAISQVTGHRVEDITPDMHLEADLGLDSIKMVALFGALMHELPQDRRELLGPGGFFSDMVRVCTVEDLLRSVEHLSTAFADGAAPQLELDDARREPDASHGKSPAAPDLRRAIVESIARVSGHRAEDLTDDLSLEADVGFDSLKRVQLLNELSRDLPASTRDALAGDGGIRELLYAQTIGDLVQAIAELDTSASGVVTAPEPQEPATLVLADSQVPFLVASMAGVSLCSLCSRVRIRGRFDADAASAAWADLIERHPALRARFVAPTEGDPQSDWRVDLLPDAEMPRVKQVSLTHIAKAAQDQALATRLDAALNREWDLRAWPLQDITAYALSADEYELHIENHHAISDGLGNQMMMRQFLEAYATRLSGMRPTAAAMTGRAYNEIVTAVDGWDDRGAEAALDAQLRAQGAGRVFWNTRGRRPTRGTVKTATRLRRLSREVTAALVAQVGAMRVPLNSLLVSAYLHALGDVAKLSGKVVLHIPTGGRSHANADATEVLGCFAQNLVLAFDPPRAGEPWPELCRRVDAEIGHAVGTGIDRAHVRRAAVAARKQPTLGAAHLAAMGTLVRASSKSNLYLPFIGNTHIERKYGPLEVIDYQASTATNPATIDNVLEIFDGALQISSNFDCEMFSPHEIDDLAQAFAARLAALAGATVAETKTGVAARRANAEALESVAAIVSEIYNRPLSPAELQADLEADLGLDSLDRVRVVHRIRRLAPAIDTQQLMACRTVTEMAVVMGGEAEPQPAEATEVQTRDAHSNDDVHTSPTAMPYLMFIEQAVQTPDAAAVLDRKGPLSYRELDERSNQVARCLAAKGVAPRSLIGLLVRPSTEMLVGLVGILKAGCAYVPLDPEYPAARLAYIVEHAKLTTLVAEQTLVTSHLGKIDPNGGIDRILLVAGEDDGGAGVRAVIAGPSWRAESTAPVPVTATPDDLMVVLYTSGSTGKPKGVMLNHRGYMNRLVWMQKVFQLRPGERIAQKTSPCFDISVWELLWPLMYGATVCPVDRSIVRDPWQLTAWMRDAKINVMHFVPSLFAEFVASLDDGAAFPDLRWLVFSGEALPASAIRGWMDRCGERVGLANLYGPTEASIDVSWHIIERKPAADERIPIGRAVDNTELVVLDDKLQPVADGVMGELWIGGVQLAIGYLNQPELTAERFCKVPGAQSPILYRTGDIATRTPEGVFNYHGRTDSQIKIRGFRVELGEIESALDAIEGVRENAVLAIDEGEGKLRLVAYVVARPGLDARAIRDLVRHKLPDYMVPHRVEFLPTLPKNSNGKLDRGALRSAGAAPAAPAATAAPAPTVAPAPAPVMVQAQPAPAVVQAQPAARALVPAREPSPVFEHPVVRELPAGPAQRWLFTYFPEPYAWFGYSRFRYTHPLLAELLERALNSVVDRHGALRTTFGRTQDGWRQIVHPPGHQVSVTVFECAELSDDDREIEVKRLLERTCFEMTFDSWPLVAVMVLELGNGQHDVLVAGHHLVNDLVSTQILFEEIFTTYDRLVRDPAYRDASAVPPQYTDYVDALEQARADGTLSRHAAWYREHLGRGTALTVPLSGERGPNVESASRMASLELTADVSRRLRVDGRRQFGATVYHLLVAPLYAAVSEWTGQRWVVLSHRTHGRDLGKGRGYFRSVGNFAVNHPVGIDVAPGQAWADRVHNVAETLAAVPMNGVAYDMVGEGLGKTLYPDCQLTPIRVNYLGNRTTPVRDGFEFVDADREQRFALPDQRRTSLLEVFLSFVDDRLRIDLSYSANHHDEPMMRGVLERYAKQIDAMLAERAPAAEAIARVPARAPEPPRSEPVDPAPERPLHGKVAIVTGGGRGIGRESALALARQGARVVVAARTRDQVEACARELQALGTEAFAVVADVSRAEDAERMVAEAIERFGGVDILVNNAGVTAMMAGAESDPAEWRRITEVNLFGAYHCCRAVIPQLRKRGGGKIVNVAADASKIGYPLLTAYAASQHAIIGLTRALAEEMKAEGIQVNAVCPAMVASEAARTEAVPAGKVAQVIAFLASPMSDAITGETISVHGKQDAAAPGAKKSASARAQINGTHSVNGNHGPRVEILA